MLKTLLVLCGVLVVSATGLQAQVRGAAARHGSMLAARPAAYRGGYGYANHHHGGHHGRYYYLGGIPFFYPYDYYGFGYPYYGGFGGAYGYGYGYGYGGSPNGDGAYNGRVVDGENGNGGNGGPQGSGASLPEAVQRQLAKRGYYKGGVDGQFGPASRDALTRFQRKQGLKETGRIDEPTLEALGFMDHR